MAGSSRYSLAVPISSQIVYVDFRLGKANAGTVEIERAYTLYDDVRKAPQEDQNRHAYLNYSDGEENRPEYINLISDDDEDDDEEENDDETDEDSYDEPDVIEKIRKGSTVSSSDDDTHSYIDLDEENMPAGAAGKFVDSNTPKSHRFHSAVKPPARMIASGITSLIDDRLVVVTLSGEILVFDSHSVFLFLGEFGERFEDVTTINENTIAATSGYSIRFYWITDSSVAELGDRLIDFEMAGAVSVHGIHHFHGRLAVTCNIQSIYSTEKPFIRILDLKGKLIRTIGRPHFHIPAKITCSWDGKMIFVCDYGLDKVSCFTHNGSVQWERANQGEPKDIELVNDSDLFVVYKESAYVLGMAAATGKFKKHAEIHIPLAQSPSLLAYRRQQRQLIFCLDEMTVGIRNFVFPLKVKKTKGSVRKSISFSSKGKKLIDWMNG